MPRRDVPKAKTRRALSKLRRAVEAAEASGDDAALSAWEKAFAASVEERLETFGSAFTDPSKGGAAEALSVRQAAKLREIAKKTKDKTKAGPKAAAKARDDGDAPASPRKARTGFRRRRSSAPGPRVRDVLEDAPDNAPTPRLRVIEGGGTPKKT